MAIETAFMALLQWSPALIAGFGQNILISLCAIGLGTLLGLLVGAMAVSPWRLLRLPGRLWVQVFRNAPWLGDDGFGLVGAMLGWLFAHGRYSLGGVERCKSSSEVWPV